MTTVFISYERDQRAWEALVLEAAKLGEEKLAPALYKYEDLITDCTFSGKKCSAADFTRVVDPVYGACYSFNEDASLSYSTNRAGMKFGLKLLVTVSQHTTSMENDFLPTTRMVGARVSIQPRGVHPSLDNNGIHVGVGHQTAISIVSTKIQRLKKPYPGRCIDTEPESTNLYKSNVYVLETCFYNCRQRNTIEQCRCANPRFKKVTRTSGVGQRNQIVMDCLRSLRGDQASTTPNICPLTDCSCGSPCSETSYITSATISKFPAEGYFVATDPTQGVVSGWPYDECSIVIAVKQKLFLGWKLRQSKHNFQSGTSFHNKDFFQDQGKCRDWYEKNALVLQVFFETLKYESYKETPSYGISAVLNDLGGHAGLWLGLSVISVIEVIFYETRVKMVVREKICRNIDGTCSCSSIWRIFHLIPFPMTGIWSSVLKILVF
ncbi:Amiloride-sensitive sodium channel [Cooperia oncophora]